MNATQHEYFKRLAQALAFAAKVDYQQYYDNPKLLEQQTVEFANFGQLARLTGIDKRSLYRWFHDTFQRNLATPMTDDDKMIVFNQTKLMMQQSSSDTITKAQQREIKALLS